MGIERRGSVFFPPLFLLLEQGVILFPPPLAEHRCVKKRAAKKQGNRTKTKTKRTEDSPEKDNVGFDDGLSAPLAPLSSSSILLLTFFALLLIPLPLFHFPPLPRPFPLPRAFLPVQFSFPLEAFEFGRAIRTEGDAGAIDVRFDEGAVEVALADEARGGGEGACAGRAPVLNFGRSAMFKTYRESGVFTRNGEGKKDSSPWQLSMRSTPTCSNKPSMFWADRGGTPSSVGPFPPKTLERDAL